eukprot:TRINITY_DN15362_c0_g1_i2.p2 TRINITY_DN15362_c0_g1~~TRINITY_DN15362_c0_g1_i2.p2  ORF type:complete len:200 (+),score=57.35 TRINITY_DN15362_c0_g1_i2:88-600(+)
MGQQHPTAAQPPAAEPPREVPQPAQPAGRPAAAVSPLSREQQERAQAVLAQFKERQGKAEAKAFVRRTRETGVNRHMMALNAGFLGTLGGGYCIYRGLTSVWQQMGLMCSLAALGLSIYTLPSDPIPLRVFSENQGQSYSPEYDTAMLAYQKRQGPFGELPPPQPPTQGK